MRTPTIPRFKRSLLTCGDVQPNPGPTTQYPCPVCTRNVTSRGVSYLCHSCSGWVHSKCSDLKDARQYKRTKDWACKTCSSAPAPPPTQPPPAPTTTSKPKDDTFNILQFNANGIGNKLSELERFLEKHNVKVAAIQESKLTSKSRNPRIQNFTTVRRDRPQGQGGGLLIFIHKSINFRQQPQSPETLSDLHLEELTISAKLGNTELIISNIYIPPTSSCAAGYQPLIDHLMTTPDTLILGDFNAHHSSWHATSTDTRGKNLADSISNSDFGIINWDTPTRLPNNATPSSPDVSLASSSLITSTNWNTITTLGSDHLPILIRLQTTVSVTPASHRTYVNLKKANWARFTQEIEDKLSNRPLPSDCQKDEKTLRAIILKAASHHIPTGRHKINTEPVPAEILDLTKERDELRRRDHTSPELQRLNEEITRTTTAHKQAKWKQFVETMDHKTDSSKLWRTIKAIDGKSTPTAENEAIVFNEKPTSSPKDIANKFNKQFTTSKLGIHSSSHETRYVSREARKKSQETAPTFTTAMVTSAIKSCSNSRAFGPDLLSIFHLKNLGPKATEYLTALFNDSFKSSRIPSIWKTSLVIPIPKPGKDSSQGTSYRPISLLCPAAKVMEALILPEVNYHLLPSPDQHGFRPAHSTTSALLQLTTDIATGFNQRKPPDRTVCVAVDLTAAFDTVCHNTLISKIGRSTLPSPTTRWLSCYLRGRQARTSCRGVKSSARIVHAGVPQGSKLSPSLFSFYLADMPRPTEPVKRVCYADDITVWASGVQIPVLEQQINSYLEEMSTFLKDNSLLISAPKSTVTLFTPDPFQARFHPKIAIADAILPLERTPKILGVLLDTSFAFHHHCEYVANRVSKRNNILKALAGTSWGQQKETLLMTYKAVGRSIADYAAPVWSTNASNTSMEKIQVAQNEALRISTGAHKMSSIDHLHCEAQMLKVTEHSDLLSAQYLVKCLDHENVCHNITTLDQPPRMMKHTLYSKHHTTIAPLLADTTKESLKAVHTAAVSKSRRKQTVNRVLRDRPPDISETETSLRRPQRTTLSQLRSGHCHLLNSYKHRIGREDDPQCNDCGYNNQDVNHLFDCPAHPTVMSPTKLWSMPADTNGEFAYLDPERLD